MLNLHCERMRATQHAARSFPNNARAILKVAQRNRRSASSGRRIFLPTVHPSAHATRPRYARAEHTPSGPRLSSISPSPVTSPALQHDTCAIVDPARCARGRCRRLPVQAWVHRGGKMALHVTTVGRREATASLCRRHCSALPPRCIFYKCLWPRRLLVTWQEAENPFFLTHRGALWASGAAQAAQFVRIILRFAVSYWGLRGA